MEKIILEEKYVLEYIRDILNDFKTKSIQPKDIVYHHNTNYKNIPAILEHGILTIDMLNKQGIRKFTDDELRLMSDYISHVNGLDSISLSKAGLKDLYRDEYEFDPFYGNDVDLTICGNIIAGRNSSHYGNEYLCWEKIGVDKLRSIDVRLLKYIEKKLGSIDQAIEKYNYLIDIAFTLKQLNLEIPLREMSHENLTVDVDKVVKTPKILKK